MLQKQYKQGAWETKVRTVKSTQESHPGGILLSLEGWIGVWDITALSPSPFLGWLYPFYPQPSLPSVHSSPYILPPPASFSPPVAFTCPFDDGGDTDDEMMWMMVPPAQPLSCGLPSGQDISTCKMLQPPGFSSLRTELTLFTMAGLWGSLSEWTCSPRSLKPPRTSPFLKLYHLPIPAQFNTFYYIGSANVSLAYITPLLPNCKLFQLKTICCFSRETCHHHRLPLFSQVPWGPIRETRYRPSELPLGHPVLMADTTNQTQNQICYTDPFQHYISRQLLPIQRNASQVSIYYLIP